MLRETGTFDRNGKKCDEYILRYDSDFTRVRFSVYGRYFDDVPLDDTFEYTDFE